MVAKKQSGFDYKVVNFKYSEDKDPHQIFIKKHIGKDDDKPLGKTLFVVNIPPYVNEENLQKLFSEPGPINNIELYEGIPTKDSNTQEKSDGNLFKTAYIIFKTQESLDKALKLTLLKPLIDVENKLLTGLSKYAREYNETICDPESLREKATKLIQAYDERQNNKNQEHEEIMGGDGWTVISSKGRNPGIARKESVHNKLIEKHDNKMKKKTLQNFYSFQIREAKKKRLAALREEFEQEKLKVEEMKKKRTFRPY